jgi:thiol-disulfide isomerase/thioredoxin
VPDPHPRIRCSIRRFLPSHHRTFGLGLRGAAAALALVVLAALVAAFERPAIAQSPTPAPGATPIATTASRTTQLDSLVRAETRVAWIPGPPDSALLRAKRDGKPAFLDFYADWCAPCRWMDRMVYVDPLLAEAAEGVAMVRIDVETPPGRALAARYAINQYPTLVYLNPDGSEKLRWVGPLSLRDTRLNLGQASYPNAQRPDIEAQVKKSPDDPTVQAAAILWYGLRGEVEKARTLAAAIEKRRADLSAAERAAVRLSLAHAEEMMGRGDRALLAYRSALAAEPEGPFAWRAWLGVSTAMERAGDLELAIEAAREAKSRGPVTPFLDARVERLALKAPAPPTPPGVDDGTAAK